MNLIWNPVARAEIRAILDYISDFDLAAAERLFETILACAERLPAHPYMYRQGRISGTREAVVHPNYILIYEVGVDAVEVMSVIHSRKQYPPSID